MTNLKKNLQKRKTQNFLEKFPIIFFLQQSNFSVNDWVDFKRKTREWSENTSPIELLKSKNTLLKQSLSTKISPEFQQVLQGPLFVIGCHTANQSELIWNYIKSHPKTLFMSCLYKNQTLNHLDFEKLLTVNSSIYHTFCFQVNQSTTLLDVLNQRIILAPLLLKQQELIQCLQTLKH